MLSGHKIGAEHVSYYLSYVERGGDPGRWLGKGAAALGLDEVVEAQAFANLAEGLAPDGIQLLERIHASRTMGWDFTLSAPKSLSLLAALHPEQDTRETLRAVHDQAVASAVSFLEDTGGAARRGHGGRDGHLRAKLVIAGFVHKTSRESEPDLHEHAIVLNSGLGDDGRWTSIDSRSLFAHKAGAEAIYRSELYHRSAQLGVAWSDPDGHGNREVVGFQRAELRAWSTRRANIEAALANTGGSGRRAAEAAALATRKAKVDVEFAELLATWRDRAEAEGLSPGRLARMASGHDRTVSLSPEELARATDQILSLGPGGLLERGSAFTADEVVRAWVDQLPTGAPRAEVENLVEEALADPRVVPLVVADHQGQVLSADHHLSKDHQALRLVRAEDPGASRCQIRYSTQEMLTTEARVMEAVAQARQAGLAMVDAELVEAVLARHPSLSIDQVEMVRAITTSGHGIEAVVGPPGAGKSFALGVAREIWEQAGYRLQGAAPSGKAAVGLGQGSGIDSTTLADIVHPATPAKVVQGGVLVLDEAGMAGTLDTDALLRLAQAAGTKVVAVGDPRQIAAVGAGGSFAAMVGRFGAVQLTDNARQAEGWEKEAIKALREGRSAEAVASYVAHGRLVVAERPEELMGACVGDWWQARSRGEVAMYAATRDQVWRLNSLARAYMAEAGRLSGPELVVGAISRGDHALPERAFAAGDEVVLCKNRAKVSGDVPVVLPGGHRRHQGIKNGQRPQVVKVDQESGRVTVSHQDGRVLTLCRDYVQSYLGHGYAITAHKAQGDTVGQAARATVMGIVAEADRRQGRAFVYGLADAELALVMASRATDSTCFYVQGVTQPGLYDEGSHPERIDPEATLARAWGRSGAEGMASDEMERQRAIKSLAAGCSAQELVARRASLVALGREDEARVVAAEVAWARPETASGGDRRRAAADLALVDEALATQRRRSIEALVIQPPAWATDVLGARPADEPRAMRWRQGLTLLADVRKSPGFRPAGAESHPILRALGPPPSEPFAQAAWLRHRASLSRVRADLGLEASDPVAGGQATSSEQRSGAMAEPGGRARQLVLQRAVPANHAQGRSPEPPSRRGHGRSL